MSMKNLLKHTAYGRAIFPADFKCLKPEETSLGIKYSFTFNPSDDYLPLPSESMNHAKMVHWFDTIKGVFEGLKGCGITVYLEWSQRGRLHFHGVLVITNKHKFYLHDINYLMGHGNIELDTIADPAIWDLYCRKNQESVYDYYAELNIMHLTNLYPISYPYNLHYHEVI